MGAMRWWITFMMKPLDRQYEQDQNRFADQAKVLKGVLKIGGQDGTYS
jgi:hypothetical protein